MRCSTRILVSFESPTGTQTFFDDSRFSMTYRLVFDEPSRQFNVNESSVISVIDNDSGISGGSIVRFNERTCVSRVGDERCPFRVNVRKRN